MPRGGGKGEGEKRKGGMERCGGGREEGGEEVERDRGGWEVGMRDSGYELCDGLGQVHVFFFKQKTAYVM